MSRLHDVLRKERIIKKRFNKYQGMKNKVVMRIKQATMFRRQSFMMEILDQHLKRRMEMRSEHAKSIMYRWMKVVGIKTQSEKEGLAKKYFIRWITKIGFKPTHHTVEYECRNCSGNSSFNAGCQGGGCGSPYESFDGYKRNDKILFRNLYKEPLENEWIEIYNEFKRYRRRDLYRIYTSQMC